MKHAALLIALIATGAAAAPDKGAWKAATAVGKPVNCLQLTRIRETRVRDASTIDFYTRDGKVWRNTLPISCPRLGNEQRFSYRTSVSQLCSVDTITVLPIASIVPGPTCGLGRFQQVEGAPR